MIGWSAMRAGGRSYGNFRARCVMKLPRSVIRLTLALLVGGMIEAVAPAPGLIAEEEQGPICRKHGDDPMCNVPATAGCDPCETP